MKAPDHVDSLDELVEWLEDQFLGNEDVQILKAQMTFHTEGLNVDAHVRYCQSEDRFVLPVVEVRSRGGRREA